MNFQLLTSWTSEHSRPITNGKHQFLFAKAINLVLADQVGLDTIFGCPAKQLGAKKRPYNKAEIEWQKEYNEGKPREWENILWTVYEVDWTEFRGKLIAGTDLRKGGCVSSHSLSDASIYKFAVSTEKNLVVSYMSTTYWASDKNDVPNWEKALFQKYPSSNLVLLD